MEIDLAPAFAFGALLRDDAEAALFYDTCTPQQKQDLLLQLHNVQDMKAFVRQLPKTAL